jgi:Protein of unknown function (DUF1552)
MSSKIVLPCGISRRNLLVGSALAGLLAPVLRMRDAQAGPTSAPRRVILVFSPNGPMTAAGPASGTETGFTLHDWWKPLERHRAESIFMSHLSSTGAGIVPGPQGLAEGHGLGGGCFNGHGTMPNDEYMARGESIDQVIAKRLVAENRAGVARTLAWGLGSGSYDAFTSTGSGTPKPIVPQVSPEEAWKALFATFTGTGATAEQKARAAAALARKKSVLDFVNQDCAALKSSLGAEGTRLLDEHCSTLRSMEKNLSLPGVTAGSCTKPPSPPTRSWTDPELVDQQMGAFNDLIAMSLACELSHMVTFQLGPLGARNRLAARYGVPSSSTVDSGDSGPAHHPWTHQPKTNTNTVLAMKIFTTFYAEQVALLVDKLKTTIDASGKPLIDSTMVLWISELGGAPGNENAHITGSVPAVLIGKGQGLFKTGRYLKGPSNGGNPGNVDGGRMMAQLLVSMVQYMGLTNVNTVGATGVNGPLTSLYV